MERAELEVLLELVGEGRKELGEGGREAERGGGREALRGGGRAVRGVGLEGPRLVVERVRKARELEARHV